MVFWEKRYENDNKTFCGNRGLCGNFFCPDQECCNAPNYRTIDSGFKSRHAAGTDDIRASETAHKLDEN